MGRPADLPGAAHLELAADVVHLDPAAAVFEAIVQGWARQQRTRFLNDRGTIEPRVALVRRPLAYDEVEALFDAAHGLVEGDPRSGRKGALTAMCDAAVLKTIYAFGLRRQEAWGLDVTDLRRNPKLPQFGQYAGVLVRYGKSSRDGPPKAADGAAGSRDGLDHHRAAAMDPGGAAAAVAGIASGAVGHRAARAAVDERHQRDVRGCA